MKIDNNFKTRITLARQSMGLTQGDLADNVGVVRRQIAAYEAGDSKPRPGVLSNLAAALGTTVQWLSTGDGEPPNLKNVRNTITSFEIPVYESSASMKNENAKWADYAYEDDYIVPPGSVSRDAFAIIIKGDAMDSPYGFSIPAGALVVIEPNVEADDGDFIFVQHGPIATLKKLAIDGERLFLESLNPSYDTYIMEKEHSEILGVATHVVFNLRGESKLRSYTQRPWKMQSDASVSEYVEPPRLLDRLDKIESMLEQLLKNK